MEKVERLLSIIMILLRKQIVPSSEFAQLFGVSKRTILRDMETLSLSNIPVYSVTGSRGGYGIMESYKMDKRLLSSSDLNNIWTALGGWEQILFGEEVQITIKKIEAMVNPSASADAIRFSFYDWEGRSELRQTLKSCQDAIAEKRTLAFDYIDKNGAATQRTVEPVQLHFNESSWYLKGFCLDRMGVRLFKLARIHHLAPGGRTFIPRDGLSAIERVSDPQAELVTVKALISPGIQDLMIERYGRNSVEPHSADLRLATIQVPQNAIGFRFLASFGTNLEIVEPQAYTAEFRAYLAEMLSKYTPGRTGGDLS